jgi:hypothetical protein
MQAEIDSRSEDVNRFLEGLRELRERAGQPSLRAMARTAHYSHTALAGAVSGGRLPSLELALAFVRACGGDEDEWRRRWHAVRDRPQATAAERDPEHPSANSESGPAPILPSPRRRPAALAWILRVPRRTLVVVAAVLAVGLIAVAATAATVLTADPPPGVDPAACDPLPAGDPRIDHYLDDLRRTTQSVCAGRTGLVGIRRSGQQVIDAQDVMYYVQRNPDGYVQTQVSASPTGGHGQWSAYWQENPPDNPAHPGCSWYLQKVTDAGTALSWRSSGWLCAVAPSGPPDPGRPSASPACNPLAANQATADQYVDWLRSTTEPICAAIPARTGQPTQKLSAETAGSTTIGTQSAFYRVSRHGDGFVELQLIGPTTGTDTDPAWSAYWQANPPDNPTRPGCGWYQERVEVRGQPTWQVSGWLC